VLLRQEEEEGGDVLHHGAGVASRGVYPFYAILLKPYRVDVIKSYGGRSHDPYSASLQESSVTSGSCSHYKRISVRNHTRINVAARCINHISPPLEGAPDEGYLFVYNYLHNPILFLLPSKAL